MTLASSSQLVGQEGSSRDGPVFRAVWSAAAGIEEVKEEERLLALIDSLVLNLFALFSCFLFFVL